MRKAALLSAGVLILSGFGFGLGSANASTAPAPVTGSVTCQLQGTIKMTGNLGTRPSTTASMARLKADDAKCSATGVTGVTRNYAIDLARVVSDVRLAKGATCANATQLVLDNSYADRTIVDWRHVTHVSARGAVSAVTVGVSFGRLASASGTLSNRSGSIIGVTAFTGENMTMTLDHSSLVLDCRRGLMTFAGTLTVG